MEHKPKFSLGRAREAAISALLIIIVLKVVVWALLPYVPYLIAGVTLFTVLGVALYRNNHF